MIKGVFMSNLESVTHYVLIVSDHNIAEFRECLHLKPKNIYLVTTQSKQKPAERLQKQLINNLKDSNIQILNGDDFKGNYYAEIKEWVISTFLPIAKNWQQGEKSVLNMTGGTKILSTALLQCFNGWHEVHYVPYNDKRKNLEVECFTIKQGMLSYEKSIIIDDILSPMTAISLYADDIKSIHENPCRKSEGSLALALMRLEAQTIEGKTADNPFTAVVPILNKLWWQDNNYNKESLISWNEFGLDRNIIQPFLERLDNLNESPILTYDDKGVLIPNKKVFGSKSKKHKMAKNWIKWIEGDWFEQLVYYWLLQVGLQKNAIATSVDIKRDKQDNSGETDLLVFYGQNVCFLETKADKNPEQGFSDFERQLTSQSDGLGLVKKYLILAPKIKKQADLQQWESFERLCKSRRVTIIITENAESFREYFGK